ncbi:MAG: hypothetical protein QOE70_3730 [Chthoniobacter sp.]|jgi:hypothetical protein|nr:hypothetical protein [Chthoniobacter sp.]
MKTKLISIAVLACLALLAAAGCKVKTAGRSEITSSSGGRNVQLSVDGPAWVHSEENLIKVKLPDHETIIEKERLLLDGKESAKVPPGATHFAVIGSDGALTVTADGAEIFKTTLRK